VLLGSRFYLENVFDNASWCSLTTFPQNFKTTSIEKAGEFVHRLIIMCQMSDGSAILNVKTVLCRST